MMSVKQWLMLWLLFISYLFLGAFVFYAIERRHEEQKRQQDHINNVVQKLDVEELLNRYYTWSNKKAHQELLLRLKSYCNASLFARERWHTVEEIVTARSTFAHPGVDEVVEEMEDEFQWSFYNSFFFALTTLSTIGYGNLHPTSSFGRMLVIVYSLFGIPLNGIVLTQLGDFFASTFLRVHERYKGRRFETRFVLLVDVATYLIPGVLLFIFLPSGFFVYFEGWTFEESVYFAFVTLTTIGYGDFVAGQTSKDRMWYNVYKVVLVFWIMFGLGYLVMILGFISQAMRSKKMARLERKLAHNLKQTHSRLWNGLAKDVTYVRTLLNELYLLRFKPVYQDEVLLASVEEERSRWHSAPNLSKWPVLEKLESRKSFCSSDDEEEIQMSFQKYRMRRRKALSENLFKHSNLRVRSESDLSKINKEATFAAQNNVVPDHQLLARVVDVFHNTYSSSDTSTTSIDSTLEQAAVSNKKVSRFEKELYGVHGFSNDEILSTEWHGQENQWSANGDDDQCCYSVPVDHSKQYTLQPEQWTWPSSDGTVDNISKRKKRDENRASWTNDKEWKKKSAKLQVPGVQHLRRLSSVALNFLSSSKSKKIPSTNDCGPSLEEGGRSRRSGKVCCPQAIQGNKRYSLGDVQYESMIHNINYYTHRDHRPSLMDVLSPRIAKTSNPVLEQTTMADFFRIMNSLHDVTSTRVNRGDSPTSKSPLFTLFDQQIASPVTSPGDNDRTGIAAAAPPERRVSPSRFVSYRKRTISSPALSAPQKLQKKAWNFPRPKPTITVTSPPSSSPLPQSTHIRRFSVRPVINFATSQSAGSSSTSKTNP